MHVFIYLYEYFAHMYVCISRVPMRARRGRISEPLELKLKTIVCRNGVAGTLQIHPIKNKLKKIFRSFIYMYTYSYMDQFTPLPLKESKS